jgi:hypothetical protein
LHFFCRDKEEVKEEHEGHPALKMNALGNLLACLQLVVANKGSLNEGSVQLGRSSTFSLERAAAGWGMPVAG